MTTTPTRCIYWIGNRLAVLAAALARLEGVPESPAVQREADDKQTATQNHH